MLRIRNVVVLVQWANQITSWSHGNAKFLQVIRFSNREISIQERIAKKSQWLGLDKVEVKDIDDT